MYCCSQLCITSRENIVCVILIKKIIILLIRTYCLIENVTFTCYSLCSWWCRFSFLCSVRNHFCTNDRFKVYIFEDTWQSCFISPTKLCIDSVEGLLYCSIIPYLLICHSFESDVSVLSSYSRIHSLSFRCSSSFLGRQRAYCWA